MQTWLKILGKGMVTIPKAWRKELGLDEGEVVKAHKVGNKVILESEGELAPYRIFSDREIKEWLKEDRIDASLQAKTDKKISSLKK